MRWLLLFLMGISAFRVSGQDLSGTWTGSLVTQSMRAGLPVISRMTWELVQEGAGIYGIIYFYPQDTHEGDLPNAVYTWSGQIGSQAGGLFNFIQGRFVEGLGSSNVYLFRVNFTINDSVQLLQGKWYPQLEALQTRERPNGFFNLVRSSTRIMHPLWKQHNIEAVRNKSELFYRK